MVESTDASNPLGRVWDDLRYKNEEVRFRAANDLRDHVISVSRQLSGESFTKFMNEINRKIYELVHSADNVDKMGGILAIGWFY
jgi:FKBP12-rapamycin complex-associated protein